MNTRQQFKKVFLEALYGKPHEEAIMIDATKFGLYIKQQGLLFSKDYDWEKGGQFPITIGRVMQVLDNGQNEHVLAFDGHFMRYNHDKLKFELIDLQWKRTKNNQEATDDDQSEETLITLTNLLK